MSENNYFKELCKQDVGQHIKEKGRYSYLSWPFAIEALGKHHPDSEINVKRFPLANHPDIKVPYLETPIGYFVEVEIVISGIKRSQVHPVLNSQNKPISEPNTFEVNNSIQRAMVKAIAMHGLGLYIYAGEDVPSSDPEQPTEEYLDLISGLEKFAAAGTDALRDAWEGLSIEQKRMASQELTRLKRDAAKVKNQTEDKDNG